MSLGTTTLVAGTCISLALIIQIVMVCDRITMEHPKLLLYFVPTLLLYLSLIIFFFALYRKQ